MSEWLRSLPNTGTETRKKIDGSPTGMLLCIAHQYGMLAHKILETAAASDDPDVQLLVMDASDARREFDVIFEAFGTTFAEYDSQFWWLKRAKLSREIGVPL